MKSALTIALMTVALLASGCVAEVEEPDPDQEYLDENAVWAAEELQEDEEDDVASTEQALGPLWPIGAEIALRVYDYYTSQPAPSTTNNCTCCYGAVCINP
jgi:PBP1b-binding outer membrane lipoprotein LpoB